MSATELRPAFRRRFRAVARQIWSLHVGRGVARTVLVAATLVAAAAAADYVYELPRAARAGLAAAGAAVVAGGPYTTLSANPSADVVDEGTDVDVRATMSGRARPGVVLHVREAGDPDWRQETMDPAGGAFTARLPKLRVSTEFFVTAGPERTPVRQVV